MERSIDELLNDTPEPVEQTEPQAEAPATPEPEAPAEGPPRDESGRFAPKQTGEEQQGEPAAEPTPGTNPIPDDQFKGYLTEKRKRQELEQQVAAMQAQFQSLQSQARAPQAEPEPEFWDNPQAVIASQVQQAVMQALQAEKQQQQVARINESEVKAKATYPDYDDAFRAFQQAVTANPNLIQQMTSASDPAEFAYKKGKTALQLEQVGSIDELLANERAKWEAEARAAIPAPAQSFPTTTANDGSVAGRGAPAWAGPKPIGDLLG